ncbi:MAG: protein TolQ [Rickettsiales bacterium]|nr:protein TolQ [Rickettsiales bacterium]
MDQIEAVNLAGQAVAHDMSIMGLFWQADLIVKIVMLMLIAASIWCWAIIFDKYLTLKSLKSKGRSFEKQFWSGESLEKLYEKTSKKPTDPMCRTFNAGMKEWKLANEKGLSGTGSAQASMSVQQRLEKAMDISISRDMERLEKSMTVLASVGSTAPFVGLFGTVWGIMNSFTAIAASNTTNLAVVAPGIAEALFATALGLVAAIPAVIAYNKFSTDIGRYGDSLDSFATEFSTILSRYMDETRSRSKKIV